jgi:hypothetical protein
MTRVGDIAVGDAITYCNGLAPARVRKLRWRGGQHWALVDVDNGVWVRLDFARRVPRPEK